MKNKIQHITILLLAAASLLPAIAMADEAPPATPAAARDVQDVTIGDIVVTATRRAESAQKVGIAINAFSGKLVDQLSLSNATDLAKFAPGVTATGAQGGFLQTFSIRGVTQNDYNPHQEGPVAAYIDDVYISSLQGQAFAVFDTDRVEILKGPQGTLFGRNATGGLIHYVTQKPTFDGVNGYVDASYGRFNAVQFDGGINLPVNDIISIRASGIYSQHDPVIHNLIGPNQWDGDEKAGRIHVLIKPSEDFKVLLSGRYGRNSTTVSVGNEYPTAKPIYNAAGGQIDEILTGTPATSTTSDPLVGKPVTVTTSPGQNRNYSEAYGTTANVEAKAGPLTISAIADYSHFDWRVGASLVGANNPYSIPPFGFDTYAKGIDQWSGELRVSGDHGVFRWTAGTYYLNVKSDNGSAYGDVTGYVFGFGTLANPVPADEVFAFHQKTSSISGFAQGEFDLSDRLTAIAGIRQIHEKKTYDYEANFATATASMAPFYTFNSSANPTQDPETENLTSWKLGLNYKVNQDVLLYATANRGVKAGGFNAPSAPGAVPMTFDPETLYAYETGFKSSFLGRTVTLNGSIFYYDYQNYQAYASIGTVNYVLNAKARNYGGELEISANPLRGLNLLLNGAYTNAKVDNIALAGVTEDRIPAFSPKFQLSSLARYEIPTAFGKAWGQVDGNYSSSYFVQINDFTSMRNVDHLVANAHLGVGSAGDKGWSLTASVLNLTGIRYLTSGFATGASFGADINAYNVPRTYEIKLHYRF